MVYHKSCRFKACSIQGRKISIEITSTIMNYKNDAITQRYVVSCLSPRVLEVDLSSGALRFFYWQQLANQSFCLACEDSFPSQM
jgi:hypothetical protein